MVEHVRREVAIVEAARILATQESAQEEADREAVEVPSTTIIAVRTVRAIAHQDRREVAEEELAAVEVVVAAEAVAEVDDKYM